MQTFGFSPMFTALKVQIYIALKTSETLGERGSLMEEAPVPEMR